MCAAQTTGLKKIYKLMVNYCGICSPAIINIKNFPTLTLATPPHNHYIHNAKLVKAPPIEVRITPIMFNCQFHQGKRAVRPVPTRQRGKHAVISTRSGLIVAESLQRFGRGFGRAFWPIRFRPKCAVNGPKWASTPQGRQTSRRPHRGAFSG